MGRLLDELNLTNDTKEALGDVILRHSDPQPNLDTTAFSEYPEMLEQLIGTGGGGVEASPVAYCYNGNYGEGWYKLFEGNIEGGESRAITFLLQHMTPCNTQQAKKDCYNAVLSMNLRNDYGQYSRFDMLSIDNPSAFDVSDVRLVTTNDPLIFETSTSAPEPDSIAPMELVMENFYALYVRLKTNHYGFRVDFLRPLNNITSQNTLPKYPTVHQIMNEAGLVAPPAGTWNYSPLAEDTITNQIFNESYDVQSGLRMITIPGVSSLDDLFYKPFYVLAMRSSGVNTTSQTYLKVNGFDQKVIYFQNGGGLSASSSVVNNAITSGQPYQLMYNGSGFILLGNDWTYANTTRYGITKLIDSPLSTNTDIAPTANALFQTHNLAIEAFEKANAAYDIAINGGGGGMDLSELDPILIGKNAVSTPNTPTSNAARIAIGSNSAVSTAYGTAIGYLARVGTNAIIDNSSDLHGLAVGFYSSTYYGQSVAVGVQAISRQRLSVAIGHTTVTSSPSSIAIGVTSTTAIDSNGAIAVGYKVTADGEAAVAIGSNVTAIGQPSRENNLLSGALAIGHNVHLMGANMSVAVGVNNRIGKENHFSTIIGTGSEIKDGAYSPYWSFIGGHNNHLNGTTGGIAIGAGVVIENPTTTIIDPDPDDPDGKPTEETTYGMMLYPIGIGYQVKINNGGGCAIGIGFNATINAVGGIAIGSSAKASSSQGIAIGTSAAVSGSYSVALGPGSGAAGNRSIALGRNALADGMHSVAIGSQTITGGGEYSVALGPNVRVFTANLETPPSHIIAVGVNHNIGGANVIALGSNMLSPYQSDKAIMIGRSISATAERIVMMGDFLRSEPTATGSLLIGANIYSRSSGAILIGSNIEGYSGAPAPSAIGIGSSIRGQGESIIVIGTEAISNGDYAVALGINAHATGTSAIAIGASSNTLGNDTIAIGTNTIAGEDIASFNSIVAIGNNIYARQTNTIAIGHDIFANYQGIAIGVNITSDTGAAVAIGNNINLDNGSGTAVAIGYYAQLFSANGAVVIGRAIATGDNTIAIGTNTRACVANSMGIGTNAIGGATNGIGIGFGVNAGGTSSICIGTSTSSQFTGTISLGYSTRTGGTYTITLGYLANTGSTASIAMGYNATIGLNSMNTIAIGNSATVSGGNTVVLGPGITVANSQVVAIGANIFQPHPWSVVIGTQARAWGLESIAIGYLANVNADYGIAIGKQARTQAANSVAVGYNAYAMGDSQVVIGYSAYARYNNAVAIGYAVGAEANSIAIGSSSATEIYSSNCIAMGTNSYVSWNATFSNEQKEHAIAIGANARTWSPTSIAIGFGANARSWGTAWANIVAIGSNVSACGDGVAVGSDISSDESGVAIGKRLVATGDAAVIIGQNLTDEQGGAILLGSNSYSDVINSIVIGRNSLIEALGSSSIAIGNNTKVYGGRAIAIGVGTTIGSSPGGADSSIVIGPDAKCSMANSIAIGVNATANNLQSFAIGFSASATALYSVAVGAGTSVAGGQGIAIGYAANASQTATVSIGSSSKATGINAIAVGYAANAAAANTVAIGRASLAAGMNTIAIGINATVGATFTYSTAVGYNATATAANSIQFGDANLAALYCIRTSITSSSDARDKADIAPITKATEFLNSFNTVQYVDNHRQKYLKDSLEPEEKDLKERYTMHTSLYDQEAWSAGLKKGRRKRVGVLAQEVQEAMLKVYGTDNYAELVHDNLHDRKVAGEEFPDGTEELLSVSYTNFIPFLIQAVQELSQENKKMKEDLIKVRRELKRSIKSEELTQ